MATYTVLAGGMSGRGAPAPAATLGQTQLPLGVVHPATVTTHDVVTELNHRGYSIETHVPPPPPPEPVITKSIAIKAAVDEALVQAGVPRTTYHLYRCPSGSCPIPAGTWNAIIDWCVRVANGYLAGTYSLPSWAQSMMGHGTLHGVALGGLGGDFIDWVKANPWVVQSIGDTITNYGQFLTAENVKEAIKANTDKAFSKDDALSLVAALQQGGYVPAGKSDVVAKGASAAASPSWMMPLLIGGGALLVVLLMKK